MHIKAIVDEDFSNYKLPAMFIGTVSCGGKCCKEAGIPLSVCQNDRWRSRESIYTPDRELCQRYTENPITSAMVFGGLEPMEQFEELIEFLSTLRNTFGCNDIVIIYTGYTEAEIEERIKILRQYENIILKVGRYVPKRPSRYNELLGVTLASDNQYAIKIS